MPYADKEKKKDWEQKNRGSRGKNKRRAVWTFIFYEEDCPHWREVLEDICLPILVSPLHRNDEWTKYDEAKNPKHKAGTLKAPHRHAIVWYDPDTKASYNDVLEDFSELHTHNIKYVRVPSAMALYLTHKNSKDKYQYDEKEILEFGGADYYEICSDSSNDREAFREMRKVIDAHFIDFDVFWLWCDNNNLEWSALLDKRCYGIERFLKGKRGRLKQLGILEQAMKSQASPWQEDLSDCIDMTGWGLSVTPTPGESDPRPSDPGVICCPECGSIEVVKCGKTAGGTQRFKCKDCEKVFS